MEYLFGKIIRICAEIPAKWEEVFTSNTHKLFFLYIFMQNYKIALNDQLLGTNCTNNVTNDKNMVCRSQSGVRL